MFDLKVEKAIVDKARSLFDVVGVVSHSGESFLILGLLTTPQRDLDDFFRESPGDFSLRGFEVHAQPKLEALIDFIREQGLAALISSDLLSHAGAAPIRGISLP